LRRERRARRINRELGRLYPDVHTELNFTSPLELLVATILSAQTTDRGVNEVTRVLFARYRTAADYAAADRAELEELIRPTGFFRAKALDRGLAPADLARSPGLSRSQACVRCLRGSPAVPVVRRGPDRCRDRTRAR